MSSVGIELVNEIERVSAKQERWRGYAKDAGPQASFGLAIAMMTVAIDEGKAALRSDDPVKSIRAYEALREYDSDD